MSLNLVPRAALSALAGATLALLASAGPSSAFTLSSPSLAEPVAAAGVEHVWWDRWGRWHPNRPWGWRRWGYYHPYRWGYYHPHRWGYYHHPYRWGWRTYHPYRHYGFYRPVRRCWVGYWGVVRC